MNKIVIFLVYIGKFPDWLPLWIESVERNPSIDFLIYTDQRVSEKIPDNLFIKPITLDLLQKRFSQVLGFECVLNAPYKICDYKPIFGIAFSEDIRKYDFWGYCDIDMIFGDLRKFITEDILNNYYKIHEAGFLSIYKNVSQVNNAFKLPGGLFNFNEVYTDFRHYSYDEHPGMTRIFAKNQISMYGDVDYMSHDHYYRAFYQDKKTSIDGKFKIKDYKYQVVGVIDGRTWQIYVDNNNVNMREVEFIHFMRMSPSRSDSCMGKNYLITYDKFIPLDSNEITVDMVIKYSNGVHGIKAELEYFYFVFINLWKYIKKGELLHKFKIRKAYNIDAAKKEIGLYIENHL